MTFVKYYYLLKLVRIVCFVTIHTGPCKALRHHSKSLRPIKNTEEAKSFFRVL